MAVKNMLADVDSVRSKKATDRSFAEWLQQWANQTSANHTHDIDSAANQSTPTAANEVESLHNGGRMLVS